MVVRVISELKALSIHKILLAGTCSPWVKFDASYRARDCGFVCPLLPDYPYPLGHLRKKDCTLSIACA